MQRPHPRMHSANRARSAWIGVFSAHLLTFALLFTGGSHASAATPAGPGEREVVAALAALHPGNAASPLWLTGGRPTPAARGMVEALGEAASVGLDPADFDEPRLAALLRAAPDGVPEPERASLDVALSSAWMRYLAAVHAGRIAAPHAGRNPDLPPRPLDLVRLVRETAGGAPARAVVASVEPRYPGYARLKGALPRLRALAAATPPAVPAISRKVEPGGRWEGIPAVRARLRATGDLAAGEPPAEPELLDPALADALRRFQDRHALAPDGVLGKGTVAALNVPGATRLRQAELALERWRWLPDPEHRVVVVQLPRAVLEAVDVAGGRTDLHMRTVIGESVSHATPMLTTRISTVIFRPFWVPPPRILKEEILPRARASPDWLGRHGMEIVAEPDLDAEPLAPSADVLARVARGELILRQRPGPRNDLGGVKFVLPDTQCIAMHGTSHPELFQLPRRERSHGCVRLEDPNALARWVLAGDPEWSAARIAAAASGDAPVTARVHDPVQVVFVYATAAVDPDGTLVFTDDDYRLDSMAGLQLTGRRGSRPTGR